MQRLRVTLDHAVEVLQHLFMRHNVKIGFATARFTGLHRVELTSDASKVSLVDFGRAPIAVGTMPHRPAHMPFDGVHVFASAAFVDIDRIPASCP